MRQILTKDEVRLIVKDLKKKSRRSRRAKTNLIVFRLACFGLRRKEICGVNVGDIIVSGPSPALRIRKDITKGRSGKRRGRLVPLSWDKNALVDLTAWVYERKEAGATDTDPLVPNDVGGRFSPDSIYGRWKTAIRCLDKDRRSQLSPHSGRHTFCSHALEAGRSLINVRDAAGHRDISITCIYLHSIDREGVPDIFGA